MIKKDIFSFIEKYSIIILVDKLKYYLDNKKLKLKERYNFYLSFINLTFLCIFQNL